MSNSYFAFRQFRIDQEHCAMKVSTDACIQGAWTPIPVSALNALDIGCGTGLLSLMLAQRAPALQLDALEIDPAAAAQAADNSAASPFSSRIHVRTADVRAYRPAVSYELVICNPPFFHRSLKGQGEQRNLARHDEDLSLADLGQALSALLSPAGVASVLLPVTEQPRWEQALTASGLVLQERLWVRPFAHSRPNRVISLSGRQSLPEVKDRELVIYEAPARYTTAFRDLLAPFYLHL